MRILLRNFHRALLAPPAHPRTFAGTLAETKIMEPIALSVSDAVKASGLGKTTLYEAMADGRLETRKVGRKRLILTRSLRRLIEGEV
ncbi:helix-turn-helix domain-containing protein [Novosphingobium sp. MD-1]|uniref:helix-turn-helix domain-containing protein n=1 Tax=Novosphingobium sp. MD-1 TaxID=1630648 RepID=UPI000F7F263E|nr:helix-turn-helix domain-containing protein [Novosphingobium sp. MD-1]